MCVWGGVCEEVCVWGIGATSPTPILPTPISPTNNELVPFRLLN